MPLIHPLWAAALRRYWPLLGMAGVLAFMIVAERVAFTPTVQKYRLAEKAATEMGLATEDTPPAILPPRLFALLTDNALPAAEAQDQGNSGVLTAQLLEDLTGLIRTRGVQVVSTEPGPVSQFPQAVQVRARLKLRCSYASFVGLLDELDRSEKLLAVDRFVMTAEPGTSAQFLELWISRYVLKRGATKR